MHKHTSKCKGKESKCYDIASGLPKVSTVAVHKQVMVLIIMNNSVRVKKQC